MGAPDWNSKAPKTMGLTAAATISLDPSTGTIFTLTPTADCTINATSVGFVSERITLQINTLGTQTWTVTLGTNFRANTLATGGTTAKRFNISFESDGVSGWNEIGRTTAL